MTYIRSNPTVYQFLPVGVAFFYSLTAESMDSLKAKIQEAFPGEILTYKADVGPDTDEPEEQGWVIQGGKTIGSYGVQWLMTV